MCEEYGNVEKKLNLHYTYYNSQSSVNKTLFATIHCSGAHINIRLQFVCLSINFLTLFLASQDALEVMRVTELLSY